MTEAEKARDAKHTQMESKLGELALARMQTEDAKKTMSSARPASTSRLSRAPYFKRDRKAPLDKRRTQSALAMHAEENSDCGREVHWRGRRPSLTAKCDRESHAEKNTEGKRTSAAGTS